MNGGSRLSNKKRRKKMKQLKKAAALAAFSAMKQEQSMQAISTTAPVLATVKSTTDATKHQPTAKLFIAKKNGGSKNLHGNSIAVICATQSILDYRESLKHELNMKKKNNGTLNFDE